MQLVNYDRPRYYKVGIAIDKSSLKDVTFLPGVNEISDEDWKACCKHPHVQALLDEGALEVVKHVKGMNVLETMTEANALELVEETFSVETLKKWMHTDKRKIVTRAISMKLKGLVQEDRLEKLGLGELMETKSAETEADEAFDEKFPRADKAETAKAAKVERVKAPKKRK